MAINNIDNEITKKIRSRELKPSSSAWERLSSQLDEHEMKKKRKKRFINIASVASILFMLGLTTFYFLENDINRAIPQEVIVETNVSIDSEKDMPEFKVNNVPLVLKKEEVIVQNDTKRNVVKNKEHRVFDKPIQLRNSLENNEKLAQKAKEKQVFKNIIKENIESFETLPRIKSKSRIRINSEDLLYAVTHSEEEVKEYYAKHKVNRKDVLEVIKLELKKSNVNVSPETILAEVERNIDDEEFKGNFMRKLKVKISDIAVAFAERNK